MKTLLSAVAFAAIAAPALAQMANPMVGGAEMPATNDIVTNAIASADHTTLVAAVQAAGLVETLQGAGPFTVLAPTNAAFAELPAETLELLLEPQNKDRLAKILTCHVIPAEAFSADIVGMIQADGGTHAITTVGGCVLQASVQNGSVVIADEQGRSATVTIADVDQSNGVIHVIDSVLLPSAASQQ